MTLYITTDEATILIAVLAFAEGAAPIVNPPMVEAIDVLRPWRSQLLRAYLHARIHGERELSAGEAGQALGAFVAQKAGQ